MICICGEPCLEGKPWCSERCAYVVGKMNTPVGKYMSVERAYAFFGRHWDKNHDVF